MDEKEITVTLKVPQWNIVMQALGNGSYAQVVALIDEIKRQADSQLNQPSDATSE